MIYLTGASGFLGSAIYEQLIKTQECVCLSRSKLSNSSDYILCDLNKENPNFPKVQTPSVVIHCASLIKGTPRQIQKTNVDGTRQLINWAKNEKIEKFIFISSLDVETSQSVYACSKKESENYLKSSGLSYCIIRPSVIFGKNDTKNITQLITFIQKWPILFIPNKGAFIWQPVSVSDCMDLVIDSISLNTHKNETLTLVGPQQLSFLNLVTILTQYLKTKLVVIKLPYWIATVIKCVGYITGKKQRVSQFMSSFQTKLPLKTSLVKIGKTKITDIFF